MNSEPQPAFQTFQNFPATGLMEQSSEDASPFLVEFFMVQGMGFRCMAYRGGDGSWRRAFYNEELAGCIRILE
jgi:hypothetical protein